LKYFGFFSKRMPTVGSDLTSLKAPVPIAHFARLPSSTCSFATSHWYGVAEARRKYAAGCLNFRTSVLASGVVIESTSR
jgi:hypothetical protein